MSKKPNIIFVLTDDQGYGDLGCTGNNIIKTPNIDKFYNESVRLTNFHVGPTCAPTRAGLMTGHYSNSTGVWHTVGGRSLLRKEEWTIASALKENGYRTGIFGKWHLGDEYPYRSFDRGFEKSIVHGGGGISQTPDYWGNDYFDDTYYVNGEPQKFNGYCTDVFFNESLKFIEENKNNPFFCYIAANAPHSPYNVESKYSEQYIGQVPEDRARFYGMISNIDENFGRLREKLKELNFEENTILIFMTDNGSSCAAELDSKEFVVNGYNGGLRGMKNSEYDGGHRVPFFIRWPKGNLNYGEDIDELTANIDFMPTMLDLCSVPVKEGVDFHGMSLKALLYKELPWQDRTIVTDSQRVAYPVKWRKSAVMTKKWRLINGRELYDVALDREQRKDIACLYPEVVGKLRQQYEKWWEIVSVQFDVDIPIVIGENPTAFTNHDIRNEECISAWNQAQIRKGIKVEGYWEFEVEKEGEYRFELRRWPKSENRAISAGIEGDDVEF
ncbi:arylsulfatase [Clostridium grantii]|uniref:Arylsulfatase A n=1 Tax=Clostridium grantii DSM 8605 TaxID=1121316 RepID=A0A1M5U3K4_9CLOT|nr:arylsulfatase [Clostridium grantii]SHH57450.1 Arylsulfatase A [Clostridium grantii DSM 8605]